MAGGYSWALTFGSGLLVPEPTRSTVMLDIPHRSLRRSS